MKKVHFFAFKLFLMLKSEKLIYNFSFQFIETLIICQRSKVRLFAGKLQLFTGIVHNFILFIYLVTLPYTGCTAILKK